MRFVTSLALGMLGLALAARCGAAAIPSGTATATATAVSTEAPATATATPTEPPATATATPTEPPATPTATATEAPATATATPTEAPATATATPTEAPATATATPTELRDFTVGGARPALVAVPRGYNPNKPAPLLVMLHGYGDSGAKDEQYFQFAAAANARGMLYVHPDGTLDSSGNRFWNATNACCDFEATGVADAKYLAGLVAEIQSIANIDAKRIYFVGHSNGAFMSEAMACRHADLVAGIVAFAGMAPADPADCRASQPVAILQLYGDSDILVVPGGGRLSLSELHAPGHPLAPYPSIQETVALWLALDGCSGMADSPTLLDIAAQINGPAGPAEATVRQALNCRPGGYVERWTVPGGGHNFALSTAFPRLILDFLMAHEKP